jgi:hypothetical protein
MALDCACGGWRLGGESMKSLCKWALCALYSLHPRLYGREIPWGERLAH